MVALAPWILLDFCFEDSLVSPVILLPKRISLLGFGGISGVFDRVMVRI